MNNQTVMVIAAHPDDEVLGLGGTIAKLADRGANIHLLILTDGSTSQYRNDPDLAEILHEKKNETEACAKILGIQTIIYGGFPDMKLDTIPHIILNQCIEQALNQYHPEIVFTHFWGDVNLDHQLAFHSTMVAVRPTKEQTVRELFCYRIPSSTEWSAPNETKAFSPNYFVDVSGYEKQKKKAIACYEKELREYPHPRSLQAVSEADTAAGLKVGLLQAEEFMIIRYIFK